jgi:CDGSH-type Zn-finger protein
MDEPSAAVAVGITVLPNGPYLVSGSVPLVVKRPVVSEHGEALVWEKVAVLEAGATYSLCRCGGSSNKPFCDGTHRSNGFDAPEPERHDRDPKDYSGTGIVVRDDRSVCVHAGFCGMAATNVWKMVRTSDQTDVRSQMIAMIERCPSGALSYALSADGDDLEPDLPVQVSVTPDGPLWVSGRLSITDPSGEAITTRNRVTLCRCGTSARKPFCDGSHTAAGFRNDPTA